MVAPLPPDQGPGRKRRLVVEETLFRQGDPGDAAYLIERGAVAVVVDNDHGPRIINRLGPGDIFGEMAIIDNRPRSATVTAVDETELLVVTREYFAQKVDRADPIVRHFLFLVLQRLRQCDAERRVLQGDWTDELSTETDVPAIFHEGSEQVRSLLRLQGDLLEALERNEFELYFQPIVALATGRVAGFEALVRWRKGGRVVSPGEFIAAAEDAGSIVPLGAWVFEQACRGLARFQSEAGEGGQGLYMSFNLSYRQFFDSALLGTVADAIHRFHLEPSHLTAEVTESLLIAEPDAAELFLAQLRKLGVRIAVDDFGTGFASLNYLHRFAFDTLKIDQSFVRNIHTDQRSRAIVQTLAELARRLGMSVVAEGVDKPEVAQIARDLGCSYGQGYYFSRPVDAEEAVRLLGLSGWEIG